MTKNLKKFTAKKKNYKNLGLKTTIHLSLCLQKDVLKLQMKPSAHKREHPALQNMKFLNFFLFLWVIFALRGPDPDPESGYGFTDLTESGSETMVFTP
jgi:hypothetical protein